VKQWHNYLAGPKALCTRTDADADASTLASCLTLPNTLCHTFQLTKYTFTREKRDGDHCTDFLALLALKKPIK